MQGSIIASGFFSFEEKMSADFLNGPARPLRSSKFLGVWREGTHKMIFLPPLKPMGKAGKYRDTVSVEPGSKQFFGSVSVSESHFLCILCTKDTFSLY